MVLSRGLLVSLGFTSLTSILLFFFIKQKTSSIEAKINTLFNLVQEEAAKSHQKQLQQRQQNMIVSEIPQQSQPQNRLIPVSDDEEESDEESVIDTDDDIESDTTSEHTDSEEEDEQEDNLGQQSGGSSDVSVVSNEIKTVNIKEIIDDNVEQLEMIDQDTDAKIADTENKLIHLTKQTTDSDEDSDDDNDLGSDPEDLSLIEDDDTQQDDVKHEIENIQLSLSDVTPLDIPETTSVEEVEKVEKVEEVEEVKKIIPTEEVVNYKKLSVKVLKEIVASKGLHAEPAKLKKTELLKLLQ